MKILIIDDHAMIREGVSAVMVGGIPGARVLQASDGVAGLALATEHADIDVVLLDLVMPGGGGMTMLEAFGRQCPALPVIVLSGSEDIGDVRRAMALGALGYVAKSATSTTLLAALRLVMAGEIYVPPFVVGKETGPLDTDRREALTGRQVEVLALLAADLSNKQIAHRLDLSEKTVKAHVTAILRALNVASRSDAARLVQAEPGR